MNTERPDHDDAATGTAEETPRRTGARKPEAESGTNPSARPSPGSGSGAETEAEGEVGVQGEAGIEGGSGTGAEPRVQAEAGAGPRVQADAGAGAESGAGTGAEPGAGTGAEPGTRAEAEAEDGAETEAGAGTQREAKTGAEAGARAEDGAGTEGEAGVETGAGAGQGAAREGAAPEAEGASLGRPAPGEGDASQDDEPAAVSEAEPEPAPASGPALRRGPEHRDDTADSDDKGDAGRTGPPGHAGESHTRVPESGSASPEGPVLRPGADDHGAGQRVARGRSPLVAASVAAAVLLVGGGGAYLATNASGGSGERTGSAASGGHGTPPPLVLDGYSTTGGTSGANGIAPGEPNPYGTVYRAAGALPGGPASAPVYAARGEVTQDEVARLARALGVTGTPVADAQSWKVGTGKDGAGPMLQVSRQAPGAWTFSRYAPGTDDCKGAVCTPVPADPAVDPVSVAAAEKAAAPVLKALGQDDAKVDAGQVMGARRVVNADPVVGGLPTHGWTTGLTVSPQGEVVGGSGELKAPVKGDTYPVLSARRTLDLMNAAPRADHRMGIGGCPSPGPLKDRLEAPCRRSASASAQEAATIDKAVFGLASYYSGGRQTLVPSWLFQVRASGQDGGITVTYPAVDPSYLASAASPGQPTPQPSGSGASVTQDVKVMGYTTEGNDLTVSFEGGVCADYKVSAKEGSDRVTVTVTETRWPKKVCVMIAKVYERTVHLDRPLDGRKVLGSDGQQIPRAKPAELRPQSSPMAR